MLPWKWILLIPLKCSQTSLSQHGANIDYTPTILSLQCYTYQDASQTSTFQKCYNKKVIMKCGRNIRIFDSTLVMVLHSVSISHTVAGKEIWLCTIMSQADGKRIPSQQETTHAGTCIFLHHIWRRRRKGRSQTNLSGKLTRATNRSDLWFASERTQL